MSTNPSSLQRGDVVRIVGRISKVPDWLASWLSGICDVTAVRAGEVELYSRVTRSTKWWSVHGGWLRWGDYAVEVERVGTVGVVRS